MRRALALILAIIAGILFSFVDLNETLPYPLNGYLYYIGMNGLVVLITFLLTYRKRQPLLSASVFFAIQAYWNALWGIIAWAFGVLHFPLDIGLGKYVNADQYFIGIIVQMMLSMVLYVINQIWPITVRWWMNEHSK